MSDWITSMKKSWRQRHLYKLLAVLVLCAVFLGAGLLFRWGIQKSLETVVQANTETSVRTTIQTPDAKEVTTWGLSTPFDATVEDSHYGEETMLVQVPRRKEPLQVQISDATLVAPNDETRSADCAGLYRHLTVISGDWLDDRQRFRARRIRVRDLTPAVILPTEVNRPPHNTVAYLVERRYLGDSRSSYTLIAVSEDGTTHEVVNFTGLEPVMRNPQRDSTDATLLLTFTLPRCTQAWFFRYDPRRGITDRWLTAPDWPVGVSLYVTRPQQRDILLFTRPTTKTGAAARYVGNWYYGRLHADSSLRAAPQGTFDEQLRPIGWRAAENQIVTLVMSPDGRYPPEGNLQLLELDSGKPAETISLLPEASSQSGKISFATLDSDGSHVFYDVYEPPAESSIHVRDVSSGEETVLMQAAEKASLQIKEISSDRVFIVKKSPNDVGGFSTKQLFAVNRANLNESTLIAEVDEEEEDFGTVLSCADNRVLYIAERNERKRVQLWHPNGTTRTVLQTQGSGSLWLQACADRSPGSVSSRFSD